MLKRTYCVRIPMASWLLVESNTKTHLKTHGSTELLSCWNFPVLQYRMAGSLMH